MAGVLDQSAINSALQKLEFNWEFEHKALVIQTETKDFDEAVWVVNEVAKAASELNHHPDLEIKSYNKLTLRLSTHDADGVTDKDLALAEKIDAILARTS